MRYQNLKDKINHIRLIVEQNDLNVNAVMLDELDLFLEHKMPVVSIIGAKSSGKCSIVNSMLGSEVLPVGIFKSRVLYNLKPEASGCRIQTRSGAEVPCKDMSVIEKYSKSDYDLNVCVGCEDNLAYEIRTGFDIDNRCPELGYMLSDIVVLCLKASALLSLDDVHVLGELIESGHKNIILCVTHLNNVNSKDLPEIIRYVTAKSSGLPVCYYSDEELQEIPGQILNQYGADSLKNAIDETFARGDMLDLRMETAENLLENTACGIITELEEKKLHLVAERELKYAEHCSKISKKQLIRLGWSEIRVAYEKLERECVENILQLLNKSKSKIIDKLSTAIISTSNPKEWWEKMLPIVLKNEIEALSNAVDANIQSRIIRDLTWLNREMQNRFRQSVAEGDKPSADSFQDFEFDPSSHSFKNLRTARYISMAGSSALTTMMFFLVGPVGAIVSATCGIISDRCINKLSEDQRDTLKGLVAGVVDDAIGRIADMVPSRVKGLYSEFANAIVEKERIWMDTYGQDVFECAEDKDIEKIDDITNKIKTIR